MINRAELKARARQNISGNMGMLIVCLVLVGVISGVCNVIPYIGMIASLCITGPLTLGSCYIYLNLTRGFEPDVNVLFSGFQRFVDALVLNLLIGIFTFLWSLLLVVPGIIKAISYSQAFFILAEHPEMSGKEALDESIALMDGHKMDYFVLCLSFIPWMLLCTITCGLALLYVGPYMDATFTNFYLAIKPPVEVYQNGDFNNSYYQA